MQKAVFGGGCFWGVEASFRQIKGVKSTRVGYMGGNVDNPTYEQVCSHKTGHIEVVEVTFDPKLVSYDTILEVFWNSHDPTQVGGQGPDIGPNYISVIFYNSDEQKEIAEKSLDKEQKKHDKKIVTILRKSETFWQAEDYHQQYLEKKGLSTCHL